MYHNAADHTEVRAEEEKSMWRWRGDRKDLMALMRGHVQKHEMREATAELQQTPDEGEEMSGEEQLKQWCLFDLRCN